MGWNVKGDKFWGREEAWGCDFRFLERKLAKSFMNGQRDDVAVLGYKMVWIFRMKPVCYRVASGI